MSILLLALIALASAQAPPNTVTQTGEVALDSFAGSTDDIKLTAALAYVQTQTYIPAIRLPSRNVVFSISRVPFNGLKIIGAPTGPKNLEINFPNGKLSNGRVELRTGIGASSWWVANATVYDIFISDVAFFCAIGNCQFWHQPLPTTLFACEFRALTFFGFQHVFGNPTDKAGVTQVYFSGHWTVIAGTDTQFTLGGSDNYFWVGGYLNIGGGESGANRYLMIMDSLSKTDVGKVYITADSGWRGLTVSGNGAKLNFFGAEFEGENRGNPCLGNLIRVTGGGVAFWGTWFAYGMASPQTTEHGVVEITGGNVFFERPTYDRGTLANTVPAFYQSGGQLEVRSAHGLSGLPLFRGVGGTRVYDSSVTFST